MYEPPAGVWDGPIPPLSPAVKCTMVLSTTFFMCTYCLIAQTLFAVVVPLVMKTDVKEARMEGEVEYDMGQGYLAKGMTAIRFLIMVSVYSGAIAVVCSVFTIQHPDGKELTPPLSPTMQCV